MVAALQFSNTVKTGELRSFFAAWGVPWDRGGYYRTTTSLNPSGVPAPLNKDALLPEVSAMSVHLSRVPREHAVYLPTADSRIKSRAHAPGSVVGKRIMAGVGVCECTRLFRVVFRG